MIRGSQSTARLCIRRQELHVLKLLGFSSREEVWLIWKRGIGMAGRPFSNVPRPASYGMPKPNILQQTSSENRQFALLIGSGANIWAKEDTAADSGLSDSVLRGYCRMGRREYYSVYCGERLCL